MSEEKYIALLEQKINNINQRVIKSVTWDRDDTLKELRYLIEISDKMPSTIRIDMFNIQARYMLAANME